MQESQIPFKDEISFSQKFWKKIREDMRMEVLREKKPLKPLKLYELHEEEMNIDLKEVQKWSEDNLELYYSIKENGFADFICNKENLIQTYTQLIFDDQGITSLDPQLLKFMKLTLLRLNKNKIQILENIPSNLKELHLYSNSISQIAPKLRCENLLFLGLGYCKLTDSAIEGISRHFPNLICLDLAHNLLVDLESAIEYMKMLTSLKVLSLYENPLVLFPHYQQYVIQAMINLKYLDEQSAQGIRDRLQAEENAKIAAIQAEQKRIQEEQAREQELLRLQQEKDLKKGGKAPQQLQTKQEEPPQRRLNTQGSKIIDGDDEQIRFQIKDNTSFKIQIRIQTLEGLEGVLLDRYLYAEGENHPDLFQSRYWISYSFLNEIQNTEFGKILLENGVIEADKARIDFDHIYEIILKPDENLRNFIEKGLLIKVYVQQPLLILGEEGLITDMDEQNLPKQETKVLGVCLVQFDFLRGINKSLQQKFRLFPQRAEETPEFQYPLQKEQELIQSRMEFIKLEIQKEEKEKKEFQLQIEAKKDQSKGGKTKEIKKKDDKKGQKKGKDADSQDKKPVALLDWSVNSKQYVYINDKTIIRSFSQLLAVSVKLFN